MIQTNNMGTSRLRMQLQEIRDDVQAISIMSDYAQRVQAGTMTEEEFATEFNKYRSIKMRYLQGV